MAVGIGMIVPKVIWRSSSALRAPGTPYDGMTARGFGLGLAMRRSSPCAGRCRPRSSSPSNTGQVTWRIVGLAVSFAVGLSIPLLAVALAGSGVAASLKARQRLAYRRRRRHDRPGGRHQTDAGRPATTILTMASLQADAGEACETGACDFEAEVEASLRRLRPVRPRHLASDRWCSPEIAPPSG